MKKRETQNQKQMMTTDTAELEQENKKQSWKPFLHMVKSVKLPWLLIFICFVIQMGQGTLQLLFPQYTEQIYAGNFSMSIAVTAVFVVLGQAMCTAVFQYAAGYTSNLNLMRFQNYIWRKLSRLPISYFENYEPRDLISRTTADTLTMSEFLSYGISGIASTIYKFIGAFVLILQYDYRLALSQAICLPLCYVVGIIAGRIYFKMNNRVQGKLSDMTRYFSAILPYITLVKLFNQETREEKNGEGWIENYFKTNFNNTVASCAISFANTVTSLVQQLTIIFIGLYLINEGAIDVGIWIAFYMYANMLNTNFMGIMSTWQSLKRNQGACARVAAVTDEKPEENPGTADASDIHGDMVFENISFAYDDKSILNDISFTVPEGKVTAIVGPSGAGKSTILNLVERFYIPEKGRILWGQRETMEYELSSWRHSIAYIPQNSELLSGTIRENMLHGITADVSEKRLEEAAKQADALDFIQAFPDGFETQVGENGEKLSGGQRQRIAIARALLMNAGLLLLDEATSNLDVQSEYQIRQTIKKLSSDHTILMVAHRMDTVRDADQIIVMDQGKINGYGTHEELMQCSELYRQMVELQSSGMTA